MSEKVKKAKILKFPKSTKNTQEKSENPIIAALMAAQEGVEALESPELGKQAITVNIHVSNSNMQVFGAETHNTSPVQISEPAPENKQTIKLIDDKQKKQLLALRDAIVNVSTECGFSKHPGTIMKKMNDSLSVDSYHQIPDSRFADAKAHLETLLNAYSSNKATVKARDIFHASLFDAIDAGKNMISIDSELHRRSVEILQSKNENPVSIADLMEFYNQMLTDAF